MTTEMEETLNRIAALHGPWTLTDSGMIRTYRSDWFESSSLQSRVADYVCPLCALQGFGLFSPLRAVLNLSCDTVAAIIQAADNLDDGDPALRQRLLAVTVERTS